jgi:hypothetical protein
VRCLTRQVLAAFSLLLSTTNAGELFSVNGNTHSPGQLV